jgi:hypothetical protein
MNMQAIIIISFIFLHATADQSFNTTDNSNNKSSNNTNTTSNNTNSNPASNQTDLASGNDSMNETIPATDYSFIDPAFEPIPYVPTVNFDLPCLSCRCFRSSCSYISNRDIDCEDEYKNSCANSFEITPEDQCNLQCDCCLRGECHSWSSFYCVIYRTFKIVTHTNFLFIFVNIFVLFRIYQHFFYLKQSSEISKNPRAKRQKLNKDPIVYYEYHQIFWLHVEPEDAMINKHDSSFEYIRGLIIAAETLKPQAIRNTYFFASIFSVWFVNVFLTIVCITCLREEPFKYVFFFFVLIALTIAFWVLVWISFNRCNPYRLEILKLFKEFGMNYNFEVVFKPGKGIFGIKKKAWKSTEDSSQKESAKQLTEDEDDSQSAESSKTLEGKHFETKISRIQLQEKPKIKSNQVKPL